MGAKERAHCLSIKFHLLSNILLRYSGAFLLSLFECSLGASSKKLRSIANHAMQPFDEVASR
jgi:hypothetical protein